MKKQFFGVLCLFSIFTSAEVYAQADPNAFGYYEDALRFSSLKFGGTARYRGIAGAATALGADISSASVNPAGLGMIRRSEVSFSPSLSNYNASSGYLGAETDDFKLNFNMNHFGLAISGINNTQEKGFKGGTFAITFSRQQSFQERFSYSGVNAENSIIDFFLDNSDGIVPWAEFDSQADGILDLSALAYYTYVINPDFEEDAGSQNTYYSFIPVSPHLQSETVTRRGAQNQWNIAYGGNYQDEFFFGLNAGIQTFNYEQEKRFREDPVDASLPLRSLELTEELDLSGVGINMGLGFIYRPASFFRMGINFTSPTLFSVTDTYRANLNVNYNNVNFEENGEIRTLGNEYAETVPFESTYTLITPFRVSGGAASFLGKRGFISADVELINYGMARFSDSEGFINFDADNRSIGNLYGSALNYRVGAEFRVSKAVLLRGGYALYGSPFEASDDEETDTFLTFGIGTRQKDFYLDAALSLSSSEFEYSPYSLRNGDAPQASIDASRWSFAVTAGFYLQ